MSPPARPRVLNAIYELAAANDRWPTLTELCQHLGATPVDVHRHLLELVAKRQFRERHRDGRMVWEPWNAS